MLKCGAEDITGVRTQTRKEVMSDKISATCIVTGDCR